MEEKFYSLKEIVAITGLSADHLNDKDGPIARVLRTFPQDNLGERLKGLSATGLKRLEGYLEQMERGVTYEEWQAKQRKNMEGLVAVPVKESEIQTLEATKITAFNNLDDLRGQFQSSLGEFDDYYEQIGVQLGLRAVNKIASAAGTTLAEGVKETLEKLKLG